MRAWIRGLPLALLAQLAGAQDAEVWRCGNSYGPTPCPGGTRLAAQAPPRPVDAERAAANLRRDQTLADRLAKDRLSREARAPQAVVPPQPRAAAASAAERKPAAKGKKQGKDKADGRPFTAIAPKK